MALFNTLFAKLVAGFLVLIILLSATLLIVFGSTLEKYNQEIMQRLNTSVAMYITENSALIDSDGVDQAEFDEIAARAMILNPSIEIYIINARGKILSHRLPQASVQLSAIDMAPVHAFLSASAPWPILGQNPRDPAHKNVFSVAPITRSGNVHGYVYAIVGGEQYKQLRLAIMDSYVIRISTLFMFASIAFAAIAACILVFLLTRRLSQLRARVEQFDLARVDSWSEPLAYPNDANTNDEFAKLNIAFTHLTQHIYKQFQALHSLDQTRRELIANTSHDLRTPLASMQGYIEFMLIQNNKLSAAQRIDYLNIAFKHCQRLNKLVAELFELSNLEADNSAITMEPFSLIELVYDCVQEFTLAAQHKQIQLNIIAQDKNCFVMADIALIHRVLQNLIDNAIRHTPAQGEVSIHISKCAQHALIEITDTGKGIKTPEIPYIFERYYQAQKTSAAENIGTGLGLAIVKRILDLHRSHINVSSELNTGTSFLFELPLHTEAQNIGNTNDSPNTSTTTY